MPNTHRFGALAALALTLVLAACSTDNDLTAAPELAAQFGTAEDDIGVDVATVSTGRIYSSAHQTGPTYDEDGYEDGTYDNAVVRRYDNTGKLVWTRNLVEYGCSDYAIECGYLDAISLKTNAQGYIYLLYATSITEGDCIFCPPNVP